ncbi:hypothetical protein YP76_20140 [Sphingobium chungbukense]|uniref:Uncharacterized protein n=1 Tax=Sphingobium chungbukense TaxID=56193 RepID=A0A0M3AK33_9SPHN|nr:hypothetical protein YP76_20140 [Sphingobium chungbukense]
METTGSVGIVLFSVDEFEYALIDRVANPVQMKSKRLTVMFRASAVAARHGGPVDSVEKPVVGCQDSTHGVLFTVERKKLAAKLVGIGDRFAHRHGS